VISRFFNFYNLLISREANLIKGVSYPQEYLEFCDKMNNDLNVSGALGIFFSWMKGVMKKIKAKNISDKGLGEAGMFLCVLNDVFDFIDLKKNELPNDVRIILKKRLQARQVKIMLFQIYCEASWRLWVGKLKTQSKVKKFLKINKLLVEIVCFIYLDYEALH
jgi:cysteinyl-tRNA synthetase